MTTNVSCNISVGVYLVCRVAFVHCVYVYRRSILVHTSWQFPHTFEPWILAFRHPQQILHPFFCTTTEYCSQDCSWGSRIYNFLQCCQGFDLINSDLNWKPRHVSKKLSTSQCDRLIKKELSDAKQFDPFQYMLLSHHTKITHLKENDK